MTSQRRDRLWLFLLAIVCAVVATPRLAAQVDASAGPLQPNTDSARAKLVDDDTIVRMFKAGIGDDLLIQTIQLQPGHYDTNPDDMISLKQAGLSDRVLSAMQAHGTGLAIRGAPRQTGGPLPVLVAGPSAARSEPLAAGVDEIGVYYKDKAGTWTELKTERVVFKSGGAAKNILTHGIVSKDMNGHLDGPKSTLILPAGVEILIYAPVGTDANEYDFLRLEEHKDNREFRTLTGGVFHSESGAGRNEVEFHPAKISAQMYTFTVPADIVTGEYGVLPPGSANVQGIAGTGKIFTFAIVE